MAANVLVDAQFSNVMVVRPLANLEAAYQGKDGTIPVAFPGALDPRAGEPGYSSNLLSGIKVPFGSRVKLWIPMALFPAQSDEGRLTPNYGYSYLLQWRLRNMNDYLADATQGRLPPMPANLPTQELGYKDVTNKRFFFPGGTDVLLYEQSEPGSDGLAGDINVRQQRYIPLLNTSALPLLPNGTSSGVWQQGTYQDQIDTPSPNGASFMILDVEAQGNELSIWAFKLATGEGSEWDFTSEAADLAFSYTYGSANGARQPDPNVGILIAYGTAP